MENRIICFVDNSSDRGKGLFHCFVQNSKIGSDAYTNMFCRTFLYEADEDDFLPVLGQNGNNFLFISPQEVKLVATLCEAPQEWKMLLVHDSVQTSDVVQVFTPETLILFHRQPEDAKETLTQNIGKYKCAVQSEHEPGGKYAHLFEIARIWRTDTGDFDKKEFDAVFRKIANALYRAKLEAVFEFLYGCLEYAPTNEQWEKLRECTGVDINDAFKFKGDIHSEEYVQCLAKLRDHLFENETIWK